MKGSIATVKRNCSFSSASCLNVSVVPGIFHMKQTLAQSPAFFLWTLVNYFIIVASKRWNLYTRWYCPKLFKLIRVCFSSFCWCRHQDLGLLDRLPWNQCESYDLTSAVSFRVNPDLAAKVWHFSKQTSGIKRVGKNVPNSSAATEKKTSQES